MVSCLGSLVQSCCGKAGALQRNVTGTCGERWQCSSHTGFAPAWGGHVCFPHLHCSVSRLVYREWALSCVRFQFSSIPRRRRLGWACVLCLPCLSSSGSQEHDWRTLPGVVRAFSPPRSLPQFPWALVGCALCRFWGAGL